ncbi:MAG: HAMP domain-containing protein [Gammaproteobacteria bacterium]|nr:HAMP domain-containing protein [Gammaproteobacteria bacterium]MBU1725267.1 HAMP domain-containing protein [Gammaproteobacteria bacterium]MBU2006771.1 HAMP domain-containing protein [Gammaproteobacteria bacterium]
MILSIRTKLFFAIFLACLLSIGGLAGIIQFNFKRSFLDYLNEQESRSLSQLETQLIGLYESRGGWKELERNPRLWSSLLHSALRSSLYPSNGEDRDEVNPPPPPFPPPDRELGGLPPPRSHIGQRIDRFVGRIVLLDAERKIIKGIDRLGIPDNLHELKSKGKLIGYIGMHRRQRLTEKVDVEFSERLQRSLWLIGLLVLPITGILAFLLARHLGKPIQALRSGARQLTDGNYSLRMKPQGRDELTLLTHDFNKLAARLQQNEVSRKQWIADIAHELRTPLAILRGEVEALQDGINQPDANTFASLHQEVSHLQRLVDDLYDLSMSDSGALSYRKETLDVIALLRETLTLHSNQLHEQNLQIDTLGISPESVKVQGDPQRLQQLFKNLLENSLRYTDKPGQLRITTEQTTAGIDIIFDDSPPGVPDESLSHLFDRLYRVEASRNRATGGAGIGLSICRNIADAHDGSITAAHSALGGLEIRIHLPVANGKPA